MIRIQFLILPLQLAIHGNTLSEPKKRLFAIELTREIQPAIDEIKAEIDRKHVGDESERLTRCNKEIADLKRQLSRRYIAALE